MAWVLLISAGVLEIVWLISMKYSDGFTKLIPSMITIFVSGISFFMLSIALRSIPSGTAYVVWTGIGAIGTAIVGILFFNEPRTIIRVSSILLVVIGIAGLKYTAANA